MVLVLVCAGCRTPSAAPHATRDPAANFAAYRTFAVLPPATKRDLDTRTAKAVVECAERGARVSLHNAGYTETNRDSADLVIYLHGKALAPLPIKDWGYEPSYTTFGTSSADVSKMSKTHIFVEAYDNKTKRQIWMDWVVCNCSQVVPSRIEGEIDHVLEGFPARAPANTVSLAE
jgi:hypothetical protein